MGIWFLSVEWIVLAAAKHFRLRFQLYVNFEADDWGEICHIISSYSIVYALRTLVQPE